MAARKKSRRPRKPGQSKKRAAKATSKAGRAERAAMEADANSYWARRSLDEYEKRAKRVLREYEKYGQPADLVRDALDAVSRARVAVSNDKGDAFLAGVEVERIMQQIAREHRPGAPPRKSTADHVIASRKATDQRADAATRGGRASPRAAGDLRKGIVGIAKVLVRDRSITTLGEACEEIKRRLPIDRSLGHIGRILKREAPAIHARFVERGRRKG